MLFGLRLRLAVRRVHIRGRQVRMDKRQPGPEQRRDAGDVHDRVEASLDRTVDHDLGAARVGREDVGAASFLHRDFGGGMDHCVASCECFRDAVFVADVADHIVVDAYAERGDALLDAFGVADEQSNLVTGVDERLDGVRADEAGATGNENP